jgi:hypothetical protein
MAGPTRPASTPSTNTILMDPTTGRIVRTFAKGTLPVKKPNLVQKQTGVYQYPKVVLPAMNVLTKNTRDPALPARIAQPAPQPVLQPVPVK